MIDKELFNETYANEVAKLIREATAELHEENDKFDLYEKYLKKHKKDRETTFKDTPAEYGIPYSFVDFKDNEISKCDVCGEWTLKDELIDTEEMADGGIGEICESCKENM